MQITLFDNYESLITNNYNPNKSYYTTISSFPMNTPTSFPLVGVSSFYFSLLK
nr:MAG TPA: hypothetical protein [Caudoviricetes sp.]DAS32666.1 MAG TPA: hypothetical protein [Caudoviricetes sp.]